MKPNSLTRDVMTIRETVRRSQSDGFPVSEYSLRRWTKEGIIPTCKAGNRSLIYYPNLVAYLQGKDATGALDSAG